jgi:hypothetical protein
VAEEPEAPVSARIEYRRAKKIVELDAKVFKPCNIKELEKGLLHKTHISYISTVRNGTYSE